jgi:hypothetical protein
MSTRFDRALLVVLGALAAAILVASTVPVVRDTVAMLLGAVLDMVRP